MEEEIFGGHSITEETFKLIRELLPDGSTFLELGSGRTTEVFAKHYTVWSVEHDPMWVDNYEDVIYIFAPLVGGWYNPEILKKELPKEYDLLLVDGPPSDARRAHILKHIELFNENCIWVFDDLDRPMDNATFMSIVSMTNREYYTVQCGAKLNGVLLPMNKK